MIDVRAVERAIDRYFRSRKIVLGSDVLGGQHFLVARQAPRIKGSKNSGLPLACPLVAQTGENCGFDHDRVDLADLARAIVEESE